VSQLCQTSSIVNLLHIISLPPQARTWQFHIYLYYLCYDRNFVSPVCKHCIVHNISYVYLLGCWPTCQLSYLLHHIEYLLSFYFFTPILQRPRRI
jgi:hypothetical protein